MKFYPFKCKALAVTLQRNVLDNLPFNIYLYMLRSSFIDNELSQRDLGVIITTKLCWTLHIDNLIAKASSRLGLLMRTCRIPDKMPQIRHGKIAAGQNATKRKPEKMPQNKNASKL